MDKRLDAAATAITFHATAEQMSQIDLAYAPPYSAAMDNLIVAADILKNKLAGHARGISPHEVKRKFDEGDDFILLDVRSPAEHGEIGIEGAKLIPLGMLREKLEESYPGTRKSSPSVRSVCEVMKPRKFLMQQVLRIQSSWTAAFLRGHIH